MNNRCLIIMPPGEPNGYSQGHFGRVYDYVIVPACRLAGYWPTRPNNGTHDDALEVVKEIVDSEIVLCDLSANNGNAHYGLAIRHALSLPVVLIKDMKSIIAFDVAELGVVEYDDSLRIDTVQKATEVLSEALKDAATNKKDRHELLNRLGIGLPKHEAEASIAAAPAEEPVVEEKPAPKEVRLPIISPLPDYVGDPFTDEEIKLLKAGDVFFHLNHGKGKLNFVKKDMLASIQFDSGTKLLVLVASDYFRKINK